MAQQQDLTLSTTITICQTDLPTSTMILQLHDCTFSIKYSKENLDFDQKTLNQRHSVE